MGLDHGEGEALKIWIDADAAPREVKELVFRAARRLEIETVLVANQRLQAPPGNPYVSAIRVDGGADVADRYIADRAEPGDLVVTQDIPLAAALVPRGITVLDPRGEEHTSETIGERLSVRDFFDRARLAGLVTGGPPPFDGRARQAFAAALDRALTRLRLVLLACAVTAGCARGLAAQTVLSSGLEHRIDERRQHRPLGEDQQRTHQQEDEDDGEQPPLLPHLHVGP